MNDLVVQLLTIAASGVVAGLIGGFTAATRISSLMRDYPPHLHVNGKIIYPPDRQPGHVGTMHP